MKKYRSRIYICFSTFYGIIIRMCFLQSEHNPPHIHAAYNDNVAVVDFMTGKVIEGHLPDKAMNMAEEWILIYREELKTIRDTREFKSLPRLG